MLCARVVPRLGEPRVFSELTPTLTQSPVLPLNMLLFSVKSLDACLVNRRTQLEPLCAERPQFRILRPLNGFAHNGFTLSLFPGVACSNARRRTRSSLWNAVGATHEDSA